MFDIDTFSCFVKLQLKIVLKERKETIFEYTKFLIDFAFEKKSSDKVKEGFVGLGSVKKKKFYFLFQFLNSNYILT